jgi:hypothetical protein
VSNVEAQRLYDRANAEYAQAKGHNQRVKERYPEAWAKSTLTNATLTEWVITHKGELCAYCDNPAVEIDHKLPLSRGGAHAFENLAMLCLPCNRAKHDLTDEEFKGLRVHLPMEPLEVRVGPKFASVDAVTQDDLEAIRELYFQIADPTEYRVALAVLGSTQDWVKMVEVSWFMEPLAVWRAELRAKIKSEAIGRLMTIAGSSSSSALTAIKTLVQEDYLYVPFMEVGEKRGPGRPANIPLVESIPNDILNDDAGRIGLQSI